MKEKAKVILFTGFLVLLAAQLLMSGTLAGKGGELAQIEGKMKKLERENNHLRQEVSQQGALHKIAARAQELGFVKPGEFLYINLTDTVAGIDAALSASP